MEQKFSNSLSTFRGAVQPESSTPYLALEQCLMALLHLPARVFLEFTCQASDGVVFPVLYEQMNVVCPTVNRRDEDLKLLCTFYEISDSQLAYERITEDVTSIGWCELH